MRRLVAVEEVVAAEVGRKGKPAELLRKAIAAAAAAAAGFAEAGRTVMLAVPSVLPVRMAIAVVCPVRMLKVVALADSAGQKLLLGWAELAVRMLAGFAESQKHRPDLAVTADQTSMPVRPAQRVKVFGAVQTQGPALVEKVGQKLLPVLAVSTVQTREPVLEPVDRKAILRLTDWVFQMPTVDLKMMFGRIPIAVG